MNEMLQNLKWPTLAASQASMSDCVMCTCIQLESQQQPTKGTRHRELYSSTNQSSEQDMAMAFVTELQM